MLELNILMETTLLFKTLVILSGELFLMLSVCFYCLNKARKAYESNSSFLGLYFRGAVNMKGQLDLIPYGKVSDTFPKKISKNSLLLPALVFIYFDIVSLWGYRGKIAST